MTAKLSTTTLVLAAALSALGAASAQAGFDCSKWQHNEDKSWSAKEPVEIGGRAGRLDYVPGETYRVGEQKNGLDIAKLLDANCAKPQ